MHRRHGSFSWNTAQAVLPGSGLLLILTALTFGLGLTPHAQAEDFSCVWNGNSNDWDVAGEWSTCNGGIPNNGAQTFDATIGSGIADIDSGTGNVAIEDLFVNGTGALNIFSNSQLEVTGVANISGGGSITLNTGRLLGGTWSGDINTVGGSNNEINSGVTNGFTLNAGSTVFIANNTDLRISGTLTNNGTFTQTATGQSTAVDSLEILTAATLTGSGRVLLAEPGASIDGGGVLTQATGHTIEGTGRIGFADITVLNDGLIDANSNGDVLFIDTVGGGTSAGPGLTNTGTLRASNGGILDFGNDRVDNTGGTIEALNNSQVELSGGLRIIGGQLNTDGSGVIATAVSSNVNLEGPLTITSGSLVEIGNNSDLGIEGTITNNGTITQSSVSQSTAVDSLEISSTATLTGTGSVLLRESGASIDGSGVLTQAAGHTIEGVGRIGFADIEVVNNGLVTANVSGGELFIDTQFGGSLVVAGFTNNSILEANNGGVLRIGNDHIDNANGDIRAINGSQVIMTSGARIVGGTVTTDASSALVSAVSSNVFIENAALNNTGEILIGNNSDLQIAGTITNNGTITQDSSSQSTAIDSLEVQTTALLTGSGRVLLREAGASIDGSGVLTQDVNHRIEGAGRIGFADIEFVNNGLVDANTGQIFVDTVGGGSGASAGVDNNGIMQASNGGELRFGNDRVDNTGGTIQALDGSSVVFNSGFRVDGGTLSTSGSGTISSATSSNVDVVGPTTIAAGSLVQIGNNSDLHISGVITNNGTITQVSAGQSTATDSLEITSNATLNGTGRVLLEQAGASIDGSGVLTQGADHSIEGTGRIGFADVTVINQGTVNANVSGADIFIDTVGGGTAANAGFTNSGVVRASNGGQANFGNDRIDNGSSGAFEALDGSQVTMNVGAQLVNNVAGDLTGGSYRSIATGNGARVQINGDPIATNSAEIVLSGAGSTFETRIGSSANFNQIEQTLTTNSADGALRILDNRNYDSVNNLSNNGELQLGGGTLDNLPGSSLVNNGAAAEIHGFGTLADTVSQSGGALVRASGGNLTVQSIIGSTGDTTIDAGASLTINSSSNTGTLTHNGTDLNIGASNFQVRDDYTNANFGSGNAFDGHANVTGTGSINATNATQEITGADITNGDQAIVNLSLGNVRQGGSFTSDIQVANNGLQTTLRGAVQNSNAGDLIVTPTDFTVGPGGSTGNINIGVSGAAAGAISGTIDVVNNFDNVANQQIVIGNTAVYREADFSITGLNGSGELDFGTFLDTDGAQQIVITINNTGGPNDGFTEDLLSSFDNNSSGAGTVNLSSGSLGNIVAGGSDTLTITLDPTSLGAVGGNITANFQTAGEVNSVDIAGLAATSVGSQIMNLLGQINGTVGQLAQPTQATPNPVTGTFRVGDPALMQDLTIANNADAQFGETLSAAIGTVTGTGVTAGGSIAALAGQQTSVGDLNVNVSTAAAGNITGNAELLLTSNGEFNGGQTTALASQNVAVDVDVFNAAAGTVADVDVGNYRVGSGMVNASLDATNTAPGGTHTEELRVDVTGSTGANASGNGALIAGMSTGSVGAAGFDGNTAGNVAGTVDFNLVSDGSNTSGLSDLAVGSGTANVTGAGYRAADFSITGLNGSGELDFGTFLDTDGAQQIVITINNTGGPSDGFTEDLLSSFANNSSGAGTVNLSSNSLGNIVAGGNDTLTITLDPTSLGAVGGNITASFQTAGEVNSVDIAGLAATSVGSQIMNLLGQINGTVGQLAQPTQATPNPVTGTFRVGDPALMQDLTISNNADAQFGETLSAAIGSVTGAGVSAGGTITALAGQQTSVGDLNVNVSTAVAGNISGNAELLLTSNGEFNNGQTTALASQNIVVDVDVYAAAQADVAPTTIDFGTVRVGDLATANVDVSNTGSGALVDDLAEVGRGSTGPFGLNGAALLLGAGQTTALQAEMATGTAGTFNGQVSLDFASRNPVLADLGLGTETVLLTGTVNNLADVLFAEVSGSGALSQTSGNTWLYDFGNHDLASVNGQTFSAELGIGNGASGPADNLEGLFAGLAGAFTLGGSGFDPLASLMAGALRGDMLVSIVANSLGEMLHTVTFDATSVFAGLADIDLGQFSLTFRANFTDGGVGVPEPGTLLLMVFGMGGLLIMRRRVHGVA